MATSTRKRKPAHKKTGKRWVRLSPAARREAILSEAIIFFAEHGFEAQTRDLASRIGVSQALIYRYFPSKADLINTVYQRVYMSHWNPFWETLLSDRRIPLEKRLKEFYKSYLSTFDDYAWIRVSVYSGLRGNNLVSRYIDMVIERVIRVVSFELRHECGLPVVATNRHSETRPRAGLEFSFNDNIFLDAPLRVSQRTVRSKRCGCGTDGGPDLGRHPSGAETALPAVGTPDVAATPRA